METAVKMLRTLPDAGHALARSLFYLSKFRDADDGAAQENAKEAFMLYKKHVAVTSKALADMTFQDFDNLLVHHYR
jgi:competence transcription factor ComK